MTCNGRPFDNGAIHSDADEHPDTLVVGDVKLILLKRGTRFALRIKDNQSPLRAGFAGLRWYPRARELADPGQVRRLSDADEAE